VRETVHPSTLKAYIKELIENGEDLPFDDDTVNVWLYEQATIRKN